ncbi:MAG: hypothetical protein QXV89_02940, partial [Candidatus Bathyarchaeia archaeon]
IKGMNISIDYAAPIIWIRRDGMMGKFLNQLASELEPPSRLRMEHHPKDYPELRGLKILESVSK